MNNSSAIKVNSSIPSAEVCCLPLSHGSAIMVVIFACLPSSTHQALSSPMLEYTIAAYFGHCWLDRNNDLRAFGLGNNREKNLSTRVCAQSWTRLLAFSQPLLFLVVYASRGYQHRPPLSRHLPFSSRSDHEELWLENHAGYNVGCRFCIRHSSPALPEKNLLLSCSNVCHWLFIFLMFVCYLPILLTLVRERKRKGRLRAQSSTDVNLKVERRVALTLAIVIISLFSVSWFPLVDVFFHHRKISGWKLWSSIHVN